MGYLIPVTPQAFVNRISIFGPDETNIKEISYQLSLHLTIPINIFTPPKSLELYNFGLGLTFLRLQFWPGINFPDPIFSRTFRPIYHSFRPLIYLSFFFFFGTFGPDRMGLTAPSEYGIAKGAAYFFS